MEIRNLKNTATNKVPMVIKHSHQQNIQRHNVCSHATSDGHFLQKDKFRELSHISRWVCGFMPILSRCVKKRKEKAPLYVEWLWCYVPCITKNMTLCSWTLQLLPFSLNIHWMQRRKCKRWLYQSEWLPLLRKSLMFCVQYTTMSLTWQYGLIKVPYSTNRNFPMHDKSWE